MIGRIIPDGRERENGGRKTEGSEISDFRFEIPDLRFQIGGFRLEIGVRDFTGWTGARRDSHTCIP
jgi:hypothetical protein